MKQIVAMTTSNFCLHPKRTLVTAEGIMQFLAMIDRQQVGLAVENRPGGEHLFQRSNSAES
jgi:hypothetical protein